jgi:hypothetical protein
MIDLIGKDFGRLTVMEVSHKDKWGKVYWKCKCICGKETQVPYNNLKSGNSTSCGCFHDELAKKNATIHGKYGIRIYVIWRNVHQRTQNKNHPQYPNYGGRGIKLNKRWFVFENFFNDLNVGYEKHCKEFGIKNTSIDRKNNEGNYCKSNCIWSTQSEQQRNKRNNRLLTFKDKTHTLAEWSEIVGINYGCLRARLKKGWSVERVLTKPLKRQILDLF